MRIASVNLLHGIDVRRLSRDRTRLDAGHVDLEAAATWIAALDADVVALQEVDCRLERSGGIDQVGWLADRLGYQGAFGPALVGSPDVAWREVPPEGLAATDGGYGVGLLSRIGLVDVVRTPLPGGGPGRRDPGASPTNPGVDHEPRIALSATVADGLRASTAHLSYMVWRTVPQLGAAMAAAARGHDGPAVLLGDVNLPMWGGWLALHARGLHWPWPRHATRANGWRHLRGEATYPAWRPRVQLDQAFARHLPGHATVTGAPAGPSDHLPLLLEL